MSSIIVSSGQLNFPSWGRSFWQDPNDGELICLYASGTTEVNYISSSDGGVTWEDPVFAFPIDDFSTHNNFDTVMDRDGNVHCGHRYNGSGCYTLLGKVGAASGWAPSGVVARGFFTCRSTVEARDFNGSLDVYDNQTGPVFADPTTPPAVQIAAVDSTDQVRAWYLDTPYSGFPNLRGAATDVVGPSGGFPVVTNLGFQDAFGVVAQVTPTGLHYTQFYLGASTPALENVVEIRPGTLSQATGIQFGNAEFNGNMAWCRPQVGDLIPILVSAPSGFDLYTVAVEPFGGTVGGTTSIFVSTNSLQFPDLTPRVSPSGGFVFDDFIQDITGKDDKVYDRGVPVDMSYGDDFASINLYFLQRKENGDQTVVRLKSQLNSQDFSVPGSRTIFEFTHPANSISGIVSWPDATARTVGAGNTNNPHVAHWHGFKVLHHPTAPNVGASKQEIVMTIGSGLSNDLPDNISKMYAWRFEDSIAGSGKLRIPTYAINYTANSGDYITSLTTNGMVNPSRMFDNDIATSGLVLNNDQLTLEFNQPLSFSRIEFLWNQTIQTSGFITIDISTSFDGVNYEDVFTIPTGQVPPLVKISSENESFTDEPPEFLMDSFVGKYVRMDFSDLGAIPIDMREIRLYGANSTAGFIATTGFDTTFIQSSPVLLNETFNKAPTGLPLGWRTYGDFQWSVENGVVQSGFFTGSLVGSGDSTAVRTDRDPGPNESGVLEVDINVSAPRVISFDLRYDLKTNIGQVSPLDPADDIIEVYVIGPNGTTRISDDVVYAGQYLTPATYYTVSFPVDTPGLNTIRWVYYRGNLSLGASPRPAAEAVAWIDNVRGLDPDLPFWTSYGFIEGEDGTEGTVYGYTSGIDGIDETFYGWMNSDENPFLGSVYGYLPGETDIRETIYGYLPSTGTFESIAGFMTGFIDTVTENINGYMFTSGSFDFLYGHLQNRFNESIYGYLLAPSGAFESINAYMVTPETLMINGYLKTEEEENIQVYGYLKANGIGDQVNGFIFGSGLPSGSVNAYIRADGAFDSINAYMITGDDETVYGYMQGAEAISGVINAWISGVGAIADSINGYIPGISGTVTDNINGFISAVNVPAANINGYIIGFGGDGQCNFPVPNQPTATVPTGNFF